MPENAAPLTYCLSRIQNRTRWKNYPETIWLSRSDLPLCHGGCKILSIDALKSEEIRDGVEGWFMYSKQKRRRKKKMMIWSANSGSSFLANQALLRRIMEFFGSKYNELIVSIAATLATIWVLSRLVFPHRKLNLPPGPRGWPILGSLTSLGTHPQITLTTMAEVYGPILYLRLGQRDCIVVSSPEMAEEFLKNRDSNFSGRPHMIHADIIEYGSQGTNSVINSTRRYAGVI